MKIFDDNENYTPEALQFAAEVNRALAPVFDEWAAYGYNLRELSYIAQSEITVLELSRIVARKMKQ